MRCRFSTAGPAYLPPEEFHRWCILPAARIVDGLRARIPMRGSSAFRAVPDSVLPHYVDAVDVDAVERRLDMSIGLLSARTVQSHVAVQGNLDPLRAAGRRSRAGRARSKPILKDFSRRTLHLQSRSRHLAGDADRPCRADDQTGPRVSADDRLLRLDQSRPCRLGDRLDGRHALSAAAVRLSLRRRAGLEAVRDLQDHGMAAAQGHHQSGDERDLDFRTFAGVARRLAHRALDAGQVRAW